MGGKAIDLTGQRFGMLTVIGKGGFTTKKEQKWLCRCDCGVEKENPGGRLKRGEAKSCGCARRKLRNDFTGKTFGKLTVLRYLGYLEGLTNQYYECQCKCGNIVNISAPNLSTGHTQSCGCLLKKDLVGEKFGRLTVVSEAPRNQDDNRPMWNCLCECGGEKTVRQSSLEMGHTRSCGCMHSEANTRHGMARTKVYKAWRGMQDRCYNPNLDSYKNYGGRGIKVCDRWLNSFEYFYADMGDPPTLDHTVEREDVHGDYEPSNCVWDTWTAQARNRQNTVRVEYEGEELRLFEIYERMTLFHESVNFDVFSFRLRKGWDPEKAARQPYRPCKKS